MVGWIMSCLSSPSFTISLNRDHVGYFKGIRGLRQGDPLSLCSKVNLTHLCFADDLMLLSNGDVNYVSLLKAALDEFSGTCGLVPNLEKSFVFFGNVLPHVKYVILNIMQFPIGSLLIRYLEVPLISSRLYKKHCSPLIDKVKSSLYPAKGGLGIKSLQYWNVALIIVSNKESLWVKWVNSYRISDRRSCMRNLCFLGPLCQFISKRGVFEAGLSLNCKDDHNHLFFACQFSSKVWNFFKGLINLDRVPNDLYQAIDFILARPVNKSIWSIIQILVLGADKVRYRLMSLRVKYSNQVAKAADIWNVQFYEESSLFDLNGNLMGVWSCIRLTDMKVLKISVNWRCHWNAYLSWIVMRICSEYYSLDKVLRKDVGSMEGQENLG
ncbi:hypothetical protein Tco_0312176 [Tanacetum coccineum]